MLSKKRFLEFGGSISTGKEANVYFAITSTSAIAVKIYRIDSPSFRKMKPYIDGDPRFKRYRGSRSGFIELWAKKEFKNLKRMYEKGIPVPKPIYVERNILLMEFLGTNDAVLPLLKDCIPIHPETLYKKILTSVKKMFREVKLVHADLSEFNILYDENDDSFFIIDVSQSVLVEHPKADEFLLRDLSNINRFFRKFFDKSKIVDLPLLFKWVTGFEADQFLLLNLQA